MIPTFIGIASGILTILLISALRLVNKPSMYALILSGIGFLYVGFTWSNTNALMINAAQALVFIFISALYHHIMTCFAYLSILPLAFIYYQPGF